MAFGGSLVVENLDTDPDIKGSSHHLALGETSKAKRFKAWHWDKLAEKKGFGQIHGLWWLQRGRTLGY
jgi:hypothetical protein